MASYGFLCLKCRFEFEVSGIDAEDAEEERCHRCESKKIQVIAYDSTEEGALQWIARELRTISDKIDNLIEYHVEVDDDDAPRSGARNDLQ